MSEIFIIKIKKQEQGKLRNERRRRRKIHIAHLNNTCNTEVRGGEIHSHVLKMILTRSLANWGLEIKIHLNIFFNIEFLTYYLEKRNYKIISRKKQDVCIL